MEYFCKICNKKYVSYKSLWNHNSKFHKVDVIKNGIPSENPLPKCEQKTPPIKKENEITNNNCNICNKLLANRHSRWRHEQNCKNKNINEITSLPVIASGGMGKHEDLIQVVNQCNVDAVAVADILHYKRTSINEIKNSAKLAGLNMR